MTARTGIIVALLFGFAHAHAQERRRLPGGAFVLAVGGPIKVTGSLRDRADGSIIDAVADRRPGREPAPGLIDWEAGGLRLVRLDDAQHVHIFEPSGEPGPACATLGIAGSCLVGRPLRLAVARLVTQDELLARLDGALELESSPVPLQTRAHRWEAPMLAVLAASGLLVALASRRRRSLPRARARRALCTLQRQAALRPVYARLLPLAHDLVRQLDVIAAQRSALRAELGRARAGALARQDWGLQVGRCDARIDRIATSLEALALELSTSALVEGPREQAALSALGEQMRMAHESVQATDQLLGP
jgi:hypothetical protein